MSPPMNECGNVKQSSKMISRDDDDDDVFITFGAMDNLPF